VSIEQSRDGRVAELRLDFPPVNALPIAAWFELADQLRETGRDPGVSVIVLAANGRGWCAGPDIKELAAGGPEALVAVNEACYAAFAAVYECEVPVIAAIHGFCVGGGIGLAGNADVIVAAEGTQFGLPEVDRGALGAATHLSRLVPTHRMRAMFYTGANATAEELHGYGSVLEVVPARRLDETAHALAAQIAAKHPTVIRLAKESLNAIDAVDPRSSYRVEQGFTFQLNVTGIGDAARKAFVDKSEPRNEEQS
jgi:enoyl-CoA hydratase